MIDCHFHLWTEDSSTPEKRTERAEQVRALTEATGADRVCLIGDLGDDVAECREYNRTVAKYVEEYPELFHGWARANPRWEDDAVEEFERAVREDGLIGLKNHFGPGNLWGSNMKCSDSRFFPLAEAAVEMDVPIIVHVAHRQDPYPEEWPTESYTEDIVKLAQRYPDLKIISAHIGGGGDWEYRIKHIEGQENVYLDTSGTVTDAGMLEMAVERLGADRLVFGTDTWFLSGVGKLEGANLTPKQKATIAYKMEELIPETAANKLSSEEIDRRHETARRRFAAADEPLDEFVVDANAFVGRFPFRRVDGSPEALLSLMDEKGVDKALVSAAESFMYRNAHAGNVELHERLIGHEDRLVPVATINPTYAGWRTDLETCLSEFGMKAVKMLPAHHDYDPNASEAKELLGVCAEADVPVIITASVEDQRQRHPRVTLRGFEGMRSKYWSDEQADQVIELLQDCPETDVIVADAWANVDRICRETTLTYTDGVRLRNRVRSGRTLFVLDDLHFFFLHQGAEIASDVGADHLVCGAKLPFRVFEAHYSNTKHLPVDEEAKRRIRRNNVLSLLE